MSTLCTMTHTQRSVFRKVALALLAIAGMAVCAKGDTIGPTNALEATFRTVPNAADLLWFFDNTPLVTTGSPVISIALFNGGALMGTYTQTDPSFLEVAFESLGSQYTAPLVGGPAPTRVNFTSINNGSIAGQLLLTVTGGTITFNERELVLYDALSVSTDSFRPQGDVRDISYAVTTPEPGSGILLGLGLGATLLAGCTRRSWGALWEKDRLKTTHC